MADIDPSSVTRIDLADEPDFDLGGVRVQPAERSITVNGEHRELQPRVMQVLVALAKEKGAVVSRDRLIELCWNGRIVGDDALNRCIQSLRHLARGFTPEPFAIETMPRIGHRLVVPEEKPAGPAPSKGLRAKLAVAAALALLLSAVAGFIVWQQRSISAEPASIAVLPFRNLGTGDPFFAEGIGEEILGQLAREPHFRVAGSSSSSQFGEKPDINEVARRLGVDYVLEGSVRRQVDRVRVNAGLVRTNDGTRLWSGSYEGKLDDIFTIQRHIGSAIAGALRRKLVRTSVVSGPLVTKGEAYGLYLTARALVRTNNRRVAPTAVNLLRDAIRIDPGYAPAWASLAEAVNMQAALGDHQEFIAAMRKSRDYARRAVSLAPNLAEAHAALGFTYGYGDPDGIAHFQRAVALDPNNAERLLDWAEVLASKGEFERELAAYQRANESDPLWYPTTGLRALAIAKMGNRAGAEAIARRDLPDKGANLHILLGRIAWIFGDYSEAARRGVIVAKSNSPRWGHVARRNIHDATYAVGINSGPRDDVPYPPHGRNDWRVWMDSPPTAPVWIQRNRDPLAAGVYRKHNLVAAKLMLNAGRWREVVATYDSPVGIFDLKPGKGVRFDQVLETPVIALALRQARRGDEANRLLREAEVAAGAVYRRGPVPFALDVETAAVYAVQGKKDAALDALDRAYRRGWRQNSGASLRDIGDEPAFRLLHGEPRFRRLQILLADHYAREGREVEQVLRAQKIAFTSMPI